MYRSLRCGWAFEFLFAVLVLMLAAGCAGTRGTTEREPAEPEEPEAETTVVDHASYERFDPAPYREPAPEPDVLVHDVPEQLMRGRVETGVTRTLEGYRIQLFQTQDPDQADALMDQAADWWYAQKEAGTAGSLFARSSAPVYNVWRQPYYRIRLGDFATRDAAETALQSVQTQFGGAFVVPDRVTVTN